MASDTAAGGGRLDILVQHNAEARTRDGVALRANVYRPAANSSYPVLVSRQPYNKDTNINLMSAGPVFLASCGYIVVMQDVRGRYSSDGIFQPSTQEFDDGYDSVQWAARLPGSTGRVGTFGRSYHAETQWRAAVMRPPALSNMVSGVSKFHHSTEAEERPGGTHEGSRLGWWQFLIGADQIARRYRGDPAALADAMAEFEAVAARLATGELLQSLPLRALADLRGSMMGEVIAAMDRPLDAPLDDRPWPPDLYERIDADTFHIGGWYDIFTMGTLQQYQAMARIAERDGRRPPHLLMEPWTHSSYLGNSGQLDFGPAASAAAVRRRPQRPARPLVRRHIEGKTTSPGWRRAGPPFHHGRKQVARLRPLPGTGNTQRGLVPAARRRPEPVRCPGKRPRRL